MRVYFLSCMTAGLKLNGAYAGIIGSFEKFVDLEGGGEILAEAVPDGGYLPRNFFICDDFFKRPPPFADVYLCGGEAVVYISSFDEARGGLRVLAQTRLDGLSVTLFADGGRVFISCEGADCTLTELPQGFKNASISGAELGGRPVIAVRGEKCLCLLSESGKKIFLNPCESFSLGETLKVTVNFLSCAGYCADCEFSYDGREVKLIKSVTRKRFEVEESVMHFAFFESVLTGADCTPYLSDELVAKAGALREFLGEFVDVVVPHSGFYKKHGDIRAAGLVYPLSENLYKVKYFAVETVGGRIDNIIPLD